MAVMVQIGNLIIDAPFFQAGLAGYSDTAMRLIARRHGAPLAVTEAMLDMLLLNGGKGLRSAELDEKDHPIAGQLMGSFPQEMAQAAKILVQMGYDIIDVNLACPVKKIRKRSRGGHLMAYPQEAAAILDAVRQAVPAHIPCMVKLRRGTDDTAEAEKNFHEIFQAVIKTGYAAAIVHGRTVEQKYVGPAKWEFLRDLVRTYQGEKTTGNQMPLVIGGSGDIWSAGDIFRMIRQTGVQLVSVARGCIGNPWIFHQARALLRGDQVQAACPPTIHQQRAVLLEHFEIAARYNGEKTAGMEMRKFGIKFSRHHPRHREVASAFVAVKTLADWQKVLEQFYFLDGPGVAAQMHEPLTVGCSIDESNACA